MNMTVSPIEIADYMIHSKGLKAAYEEAEMMVKTSQTETVIEIWQKVYDYIESKRA